MKTNAPDRIRQRTLAAGFSVLGGLVMLLGLSGCKPGAPEAKPPANSQSQTSLPFVLAITNLPGPTETTDTMATPDTTATVTTAATTAAVADVGKDPFKGPTGTEGPMTNAETAVLSADTNTQTAGLLAQTNATPDSFLAPTKFPVLLVQGVFDRPTNSSVLINGRALFVGDFINDAKVVAIAPQQVTLEYRGMQKTLKLEAEFPPLKLEAVSAKPPASARINGQTVKVGDLVERVKVLAIETNRVLVELNGVQKELEWRAQFPEVKLQGIVYRATNPSALIDGQSVTVGDAVGEVKVLEIQTNSVKLEYQGLVRTLELPSRP